MESSLAINKQKKWWHKATIKESNKESYKEIENIHADTIYYNKLVLTIYFFTTS